MERLSTEKLYLLPIPNQLRQICKSISALEAIISPEWEYRYYSYQNDWNDIDEFCGMRNGQGDQMLLLFRPDSVVINGFAHESEMNGWKEVTVKKKKIFVQEIAKGVVNDLPEEFGEFVFGEPVRSIGSTFCIWQTKSDEGWKIGDIELPKDRYKDGSADLLHLLDGKPETYKVWAEQYYDETFEERELKLDVVERIYSGEKLTLELVKQINPELEDLPQLKSDLDEIGYGYEL